MSWLKALTLVAVGLVGAGLAIRTFAGLPPLSGRSPSTFYSDTQDTRLGAAIGPRVEAHPGRSGVHPLADGPDAFAARVLLARAAERSIDAQYYIWHGDLTGTLLFDELRAAADRGVRVRLLQDDNTTHGLDEILAALDSHPNIEVRLFNPFVIRTPRFIGYLTDFPRLNRRMHNKSFTVDNQATIIGGRNIGDEYFGAGDGALFADLDVLAIGPVVRDVSSDFDLYWESASAYPADRILSPAPDRALDAFARRAAGTASDPEARRYVEAVEQLPIVAQLRQGDLPLIWAPVRMISDDPAKGLGTAGPGALLITQLEELLEHPSVKVGLVSGYFVPTEAGVERLSEWVRRGVDVTVLTNALESTDVPIVHAGYAPHRKKLLEAGVKLWEIRSPARPGAVRREASGIGSTGSVATGSGTALHAKTFIVDGERVFIGSFNFDPRSARLNTELGFVIHSADLAVRMDETFARLVPQAAYEVKLSEEGRLYWIERRDGREIRHDVEPGTTRLQRTMLGLVSLLPIEWLL